MFLGYVVLQLFCIYICATCNVISFVKYVLYSYISTFHSTYAVHNMVLLCSSLISCLPGIIIIIIIIDMNVSCHRSFFPGTSLEPAVIPTAQASSFTLQYFPYYV